MGAVVGQAFGRLTVVGRQGRSVRCLCSCGTLKVVHASNLTAGRTSSCGCLQRESATKHGHAGSPTYRSWRAAIGRCNNPSDPSYSRYGGAGVSFHPAWLAYEAFVADMGERPLGTSLDRINPAGNYEPSNCRWADAVTQARNTRKPPRLIDTPVGPLRMCEAVEISGIPRVNLAARIRLGWPANRLFAPITHNSNRNKDPA